MTENLKKLFQNIPFDKAYEKTIEYDKQTKTLKEQGAVLNGKRKLDKKYTDIIFEFIEFSRQFSQDEYHALIKRSIEENNLKK